jgi:hypothetical protein
LWPCPVDHIALVADCGHRAAKNGPADQEMFSSLARGADHNECSVAENLVSSALLPTSAPTRQGDDDYKRNVSASHERRLAQAETVAAYVDARFVGSHDTALYAVVGDFNDTPASPWVNPLLTSPHLTDVLAVHLPVTERWTHYYRSKNSVSQIDQVLASKALARRIGDLLAADPAKKPHIEREGLAYRELNASGLVLPKEAWLVHFEDDGVTPVPPGITLREKVEFRFPRYPEVMANWKSNVSDHCPVKVWF